LIFKQGCDKVAQHINASSARTFSAEPLYQVLTGFMKFILGKKGRMTQIFEEDGRVIPVTVINVQPSVVTQLKTEAIDGYSAAQIGSGHRRESNVAKAQIGHTGDLGAMAYLREFRLTADEVSKMSRGDKIEVSSFEPGDVVSVTAISKGKGFQGVVKRHGFAGGPRTHGQKHSEREPGSIGSTGIQRVLKGTRMAGRMGGRQVTVRNLKVVRSMPESGQLMIKGAVPGRPGSLVKIKSR